jgi:hypothetical protein
MSELRSLSGVKLTNLGQLRIDAFDPKLKYERELGRPPSAETSALDRLCHLLHLRDKELSDWTDSAVLYRDNAHRPRANGQLDR